LTDLQCRKYSAGCRLILDPDREGGRKSFRDVKHYRRRKRWLG
jgi:hypothetical protein